MRRRIAILRRIVDASLVCRMTSVYVSTMCKTS